MGTTTFWSHSFLPLPGCSPYFTWSAVKDAAIMFSIAAYLAFELTSLLWSRFCFYKAPMGFILRVPLNLRRLSVALTLEKIIKCSLGWIYFLFLLRNWWTVVCLLVGWLFLFLFFPSLKALEKCEIKQKFSL